MSASGTARIVLEVELNAQRIPMRLRWQATEEAEEFQSCTAVLLSLWDKRQRQSLGLDLWTPEMEVPDMHALYYQTFLRLADTLERAVHDAELADQIRAFARSFAQQAAARLARPSSDPG
ncbi:MAG: gliding motility protein GldC [Bacteroidetes bacterium]|nr:gliding motility protein GldC [Rhodothermia bacterium]MCS7154471.1 gliding motility protein GldC [Bacteroidota bacterium]MCX7906844.1 gliding motility protein GldC [Bacteroidota bacterium]MDW8136877.1 gliding motility protein GldC [Bacteroidota bacterium]MDW8285253.1 gliding motility protein GldC [Bacteroidota bacterium]